MKKKKIQYNQVEIEYHFLVLIVNNYQKTINFHLKIKINFLINL